MSVIRVEGLSKRYRLGRRGGYATLRDALSLAARRALRAGENGDAGHVWALRNLTFEVAEGEVLGIVGANGAGKSTLLKVLSRITEPTSGRAEIQGHVASLIEIGTGFHPELTGLENVYLNGAILGMRRGEIDAKLADIVEFSGVERFMDTPLKRYSTGMAVRLGFAVAAHLEPEVLLVDEVLAVGDAEFQRRCIGKIGEVASSGRTVLFVSHNMSVVARLCTRAIWLDSGRLHAEGPAREVVEEYLTEGTSGGERKWDAPLEAGNPFRPQTLSIVQRGTTTDSIDARESFSIELEYELDREIPDFLVELTIRTADGIAVLTVRDRDDPEIDARFQTRPPGRYRTVCTVPADIFNEGRFIVRLRVFRPKVEHFLIDERAALFSVYALGGVGSHPDVPARGILRPVFDWEVEHEPAEAESSPV